MQKKNSWLMKKIFQRHENSNDYANQRKEAVPQYPRNRFKCSQATSRASTKRKLI